MPSIAARARRAAALLAALAPLLAPAAHAQEKASVRVGSLAGITGAVAETAVDVTQARSLAAQQVNAEGGIGPKGLKLELALADSACDAAAAIDATRALIEEARIVAALAPMCSGAALAAAEQVAIPAGLVMIADTATSSALAALDDHDLVFRVSPSDSRQAMALVRAARERGVTKVAVAHADDAYHSDLAAMFVAAFEAAEGEVAVVAMHEAGSEDHSGAAAALAASGADALVLLAYYNASGIDLLEAAAKAGAFRRILTADGMANPEVGRRVAPAKLAGLTVVFPAADRGSDAWARFAAAAEAAGMDPDQPYAAQAYDASFLLALAVEKAAAAGAPSRESVAAAIRAVAQGPGETILPGEWRKAKAAIAGGEAIDYRGASGPVSFDKAGEITGRFVVGEVAPDGSWSESTLE
jgi:branched-chain amino acid transport system substrate-binding protein